MIANMIKIMKLMIPFTPHLAYECLTNLNCKEINQWPNVNEKTIENSEIKMVVQINGKTRGVVKFEADVSKENVIKSIMENDSFKKYFYKKSIIKEVYVPKRLVNFVTK